MCHQNWNTLHCQFSGLFINFTSKQSPIVWIWRMPRNSVRSFKTMSRKFPSEQYSNRMDNMHQAWEKYRNYLFTLRSFNFEKIRIWFQALYLIGYLCWPHEPINKCSDIFKSQRRDNESRAAFNKRLYEYCDRRWPGCAHAGSYTRRTVGHWGTDTRSWAHRTGDHG